MDYSNQGCILSSLRVKRSFELIFKHILRKSRQSEKKADTHMKRGSFNHEKLVIAGLFLLPSVTVSSFKSLRKAASSRRNS